MHRLVSGVLVEGEGTGTRDVDGREGGARAVAGWYLCRGGIDEADEGAGDVDGNIFRVEEPRVVATVPDEELLFDSSVQVGECAALWLEDGPDMLVGRDDVEACERLLFERAMTCFVVESDLWKLASRDTASALFAL